MPDCSLCTHVCLIRTWGPPGTSSEDSGRADTHAGTRSNEFVGTPSLSRSAGAWNGATKPIIQSSGAVLQRGQEMCVKLATKGSAPIATCLSTFVAGSTAFSLVQTVQLSCDNDIISSATTAPDNTKPALTVQDVPDAVRRSVRQVCGIVVWANIKCMALEGWGLVCSKGLPLHCSVGPTTRTTSPRITLACPNLPF